MPKRRRGARGDGYVSWDKARRRWRASVPLPSGGSKTRYFGEADYAAAEAWRQEQLKAIREKRDLKAGRQLVKEALAELLADRAYWREGTQQTHDIYARHIVDDIGRMAVEDVQPFDVDRMDKKHRETLTKAVSDAILFLANALYRRLMALRIVTFNPVAAYMEITPAKARGGKPLRKGVKLDAGMCRRLLAHIAPEWYEPCLWFMVYGLRWGELCGLRRANVRGGVLSVVEQRRAHGGRYDPSDTKTPQSERDLPAVLDMPPGESDLVFMTRLGRPLGYTMFCEALTAACKKAGLPRVRPHDLRHTAGSGLLRLKCPLTYVAQFLGHKRASQTEEYAEVTTEELRPYVEQWARMLVGEAEGRKRAVF